MDPAFHVSGPAEKPPEFVAFAPHKFPEFHKSDLLHLHAGVSFNAPEQIRAPPRGQAVPPSRIPQKADERGHESQDKYTNRDRLLAEMGVDILGLGFGLPNTCRAE